MAHLFRNSDHHFSTRRRNGTDGLWFALFALEIILVFLGTVSLFLTMLSPYFAAVAGGLFALAVGLSVYMIFRALSRDLSRRQKENQAWMRFADKFRRRPKPHKPPLPADTADHIFRRCPHCRSTLRLPRTPGKHSVKCPRCGERFGVKVRN